MHTCGLKALDVVAAILAATRSHLLLHHAMQVHYCAGPADQLDVVAAILAATRSSFLLLHHALQVHYCAGPAASNQGSRLQRIASIDVGQRWAQRKALLCKLG